MTQPMPDERLAEIRHAATLAAGYTKRIIEDAVAEIDRLSNDYAILVKFNNTQIDLTHKHIKQIADLHAENKSFRAVLEAHENVKAKLQAQLKSAREIIQMASGIQPDWKISIHATKWLKENPA